MATVDMDMDDEDIWANSTSPSASPPQLAGGFISTQLSLNSHLHLLSSAADRGSRPDHPGGGDGIYAADGGILHHVGLGLGTGFSNAGAPSPVSFSYGLDAVPAPLDVGPDGAVTLAGAAVRGTDRRKKRMIKNRESAARSRARKQAYVGQLERDVKQLQQENKSLRAKYEQLRVSLEVPVPAKKTLQRMPSAPF